MRALIPRMYKFQGQRLVKFLKNYHLTDKFGLGRFLNVQQTLM